MFSIKRHDCDLGPEISGVFHEMPAQASVILLCAESIEIERGKAEHSRFCDYTLDQGRSDAMPAALRRDNHTRQPR